MTRPEIEELRKLKALIPPPSHDRSEMHDPELGCGRGCSYDDLEEAHRLIDNALPALLSAAEEAERLREERDALRSMVDDVLEATEGANLCEDPDVCGSNINEVVFNLEFDLGQRLHALHPPTKAEGEPMSGLEFVICLFFRLRSGLRLWLSQRHEPAGLMLTLGWTVWFVAAVESGDSVIVGMVLIVTGVILAGIAAGVWESR